MKARGATQSGPSSVDPGASRAAPLARERRKDRRELLAGGFAILPVATAVHELVFVGNPERSVVALSAVTRVGAVAAVEGVGTLSAIEGVVAASPLIVSFPKPPLSV